MDLTLWERVPELARRYWVHVAGLGIAVVVFLIGWGAWAFWQNQPAPLDTGIVVDRDFTPAHWEDYQRPVSRTRPGTRTVCTGGYGDTPRTCRTETYTETYTDYVWDTRWVEDDWDLTVNGCSLDKQGDEHCRGDNVDVNRHVYDKCQINDRWFRHDPEGCPPR